MDSVTCDTDHELKLELEPMNLICRCCLSTERQMKNVVVFASHFKDLAGINVLESEGLPQWLCLECCLLLQKSVKFKQKVLRANAVLYEYLTRCAPFPIDARDQELSKYQSPHLCATDVLTIDTCGKGKLGFHKPVQHIKQSPSSLLDVVEIPQVVVNKTEELSVKEEDGVSDYEDNITLEEYRSTVSKAIEDNVEQIPQEGNKAESDHEEKKEEVKKKRKKKKGVKPTKRRSSEDFVDKNLPVVAVAKPSLRKPVVLDPEKIRVVTLDPEEQVKQREEESKASLKFPYQCNLCYKGFNFEAKLQNHMRKHSPSRGPFECRLCSMYLPTAYSYSVHMLIHTRRYECCKCGRRMIDRVSILDHYRSQHEGVTTLYNCHLCGKVSSNSKTHRGHMRNHHGGERPECERCGKTFVNKDSLAEHAQIHEGVKNYECSECGKSFRTRTQVKLHQLKHSDIKDYYCVECDVRFKSAHSLRQHLQKSLKHKDTQSLKYVCERCHKRFENEASLQHHVSVQHLGERAHRCPQCPARLASRNSLRKHQATVHRGLKPAPRHVCDTCGRAFRGKSVLVNHIRTHTGEKPFECSECGRKFTQRTAMRTHVKLVHLKIRRSAKIKPEVPVEAREPKIDVNMFAKDAPAHAYEAWPRPAPPPPPCDIYFHVTVGP